MSDDAQSAIPTGTATGIGSLPGTDPRGAAALAAGELGGSGLVFLPELPARGVGADVIGRTAGLLVDLPVDYVHRTYRLAASPTAETRRARDYLRWDLDALEERWETADLRGEAGVVKIQAAGPFTFAAHVELRGGHKVIRDRGALRDVAASLAAGLDGQAAELERRLGVRVVVQLDEPSIGDVIDGTVTPLTRLDPILPIPVPEIAQLLEGVAQQVARPMILHSCASPRWELLRAARSYALSMDLTQLRVADYDRFGETLDSGRTLLAGVVPAVDPGLPQNQVTDDLVTRLTGLIDRIGLPRGVFREQLLVTSTCGLAGATVSWARAALAISTTVADALTTA
ncbi:vitamin-B12 independent methionine synthase [Gordonia sp. PP30]|uniref:vitamin-B12 independent methionine synthase n=1 Tax=Gordonia sp. PP30 TaxID=2935861 RepID=UPI0020002730|nr:vitamin-B12 independent methionine synthase [Gordonia sp. PP30]UQE73972.1 vitamin-B12 independent methionine synthase [Gordonia sp. PP30]